MGGGCEQVCTPHTVVVLVLVLHRGVVTVSSAGPRGLFKGMTTATSRVIARFPLLLPGGVVFLWLASSGELFHAYTRFILWDVSTVY